MTAYLITGAGIVGGDQADLLIDNGEIVAVGTGLDRNRMAQLPDEAIVLHPGPMNRGMEISADVADSTRSVIVEQVTNGVAVRMAVLYLLLSGSPETSPATTEETIA